MSCPGVPPCPVCRPAPQEATGQVPRPGVEPGPKTIGAEARNGPSRRCCACEIDRCQSPPRGAGQGRSPGPTWAVGVVTRTHRPPVFRWLGRHSVEFSRNRRFLRTDPCGFSSGRCTVGATHLNAWCVLPTTHVGRRIPRRQPRRFRLGAAGSSRAVVVQLSPTGGNFGSVHLGVHSCTPR